MKRVELWRERRRGKAERKIGPLVSRTFGRKSNARVNLESTRAQHVSFRPYLVSKEGPTRSHITRQRLIFDQRRLPAFRPCHILNPLFPLVRTQHPTTPALGVIAGSHQCSLCVEDRFACSDESRHVPLPARTHRITRKNTRGEAQHAL